MQRSNTPSGNIKFLIIQTAFLGDTILATALAEKLHLFYPAATIDFLVRKGNEQLFDHHPFLNRILIWDKKKNKIQNLFKLLWEIRKSEYNFVINCHGHFSSGLLTAFSKAKVTSGFRSNPLSPLFTKKYTRKFDGSHETQRNQQLIAFLTDLLPAKPKLYPVGNLQKISPGPQFVTISPASIWYTKQFPKEKWAMLISKIPHNIEVNLLGGPGDRELCEEISRLSGRESGVYNKSGELNYLESAFLMKNAVLNYVNDSAPMHLASAVNAPVCVVYCSTLPSFGFGPLSDTSHIIELNEKLNCRPCGIHGHKKCPEGHFTCANEISATRLLDILHLILNK